MELDTNRLIELRRSKCADIRQNGGNPYGNGIAPDATSSRIRERFGEMSAEELETVEGTFRLAGRIMAVRDFGNMVFFDLADVAGRLQLVANKKVLGLEAHKLAKSLDIGDIVYADGKPYKTRTGEMSLLMTHLGLLTKSLRPLPEKWHGLTDVETRYRQRYVDLLMNPEVREVFLLRQATTRYLRDFFAKREFVEVETPMMHPIAGGAAARPFVTHHNALDMALYLRIAPELYLKRLLVGGYDRVFEINRNFRNEGISTQHNPEFTMLEFYQAYAVYTDLMDLVEEMFRGLAETVLGKTVVEYGELAVDFGKPFRRVTVLSAVIEGNADFDASRGRDADYLRAFAKAKDLDVHASWGWGKILVEIYEKTVERTLVDPTFVYHYPIEVSPLARRNADDPELADRWELLIGGRELANAFSELNDPDDQRSRFEDQMKARLAGDEEAQPFDADYIRALEYGMPPAAGCGIGVDRLVMLLANQPSIRDVILFPHLRPEQ